MRKYWETIIVWAILVVGVALATGIGYLFAVRVYEPKINKLENEIQTQYQYNGQLQNDLAWMDDYIDLVEEIYEGKITEAVLEERVKQLENAKNEKLPNGIYDYYDDYINQIIDDLDDAVEITIYYYENTDQAVDLITYIALNYPTLYQRLLSYT